MLSSGAMSACVRRSLLLVSVLLAAGCLSPTLPLPPPGRPDVTEVSPGTYRLTGGVPPRSEVYAYNLRTQLINGQATDETGAYSFTIEAEPRDVIELWYSSGTRESQTTEFQIPDRP